MTVTMIYRALLLCLLCFFGGVTALAVREPAAPAGQQLRLYALLRDTEARLTDWPLLLSFASEKDGRVLASWKLPADHSFIELRELRFDSPADQSDYFASGEQDATLRTYRPQRQTATCQAAGITIRELVGTLNAPYLIRQWRIDLSPTYSQMVLVITLRGHNDTWQALSERLVPARPGCDRPPAANRPFAWVPPVHPIYALLQLGEQHLPPADWYLHSAAESPEGLGISAVWMPYAGGRVVHVLDYQFGPGRIQQSPAAFFGEPAFRDDLFRTYTAYERQGHCVVAGVSITDYTAQVQTQTYVSRHFVVPLAGGLIYRSAHLVAEGPSELDSLATLFFPNFAACRPE